MRIPDSDACNQPPLKRDSAAPSEFSAPAQPQGGKWGPLAILVFWLVVMGALYAGMTRYLQPRAMTVTAAGELIIPRARDGHFYANGEVNGQPVRFLIDTGASFVAVSEKLGKAARLAGGQAMIFRTANGDLRGRMHTGVAVSVGPIALSSTRVGVGLVAGDDNIALLGQSFLSRFEMVVSGEKMTLRLKPEH